MTTAADLIKDVRLSIKHGSHLTDAGPGSLDSIQAILADGGSLVDAINEQIRSLVEDTPWDENDETPPAREQVSARIELVDGEWAMIYGDGDVIAPAAWKHDDPTEEARWVWDADEAQRIASEDPSLIVWFAD